MKKPWTTSRGEPSINGSVPTQQSSTVPMGGTRRALEQTPVCQGHRQPGFYTSLKSPTPSRASAGKIHSEEGRAKLHRKSPVHPPVTWLTQNASLSQITASWLCCQHTQPPPGNAHCLGTMRQLCSACLFAQGSFPRALRDGLLRGAAHPKLPGEAGDRSPQRGPRSQNICRK